MANSDSTTPKVAAPLSENNENVPSTPKLEDLQGWRSKLDTQVKAYQNELSEIKSSLNAEVDQLRADFQELRTILQQQQDDVAMSLRNYGLHDDNAVTHEGTDVPKAEIKEEVIEVVPKVETQD
ncbi:OLC1v1020394C1 [Oldenlandia corymbosa var. corymbosa]|uniref:OLC1v1020394C1 n=1 Tax=Oldenlandia corymbosa var. corymbosa TaxID=529605 RepID=A0AAV1EGL3_OLDCO|nr:OLC1v1020394C1 [Oldenlandia corymbosa var. corymbosa]